MESILLAFLAIAVGVISIVVIAVGVGCLIGAKQKKNTRFILDHSIALRALRAINRKYTFLSLPSFDMVYSYDNQNFYESVSTKDYLTYQLVYIAQDVKKAMEDAAVNRSLYTSYQSEASLCELGCFDAQILTKQTAKILQLEKKYFRQMLLKPVMDVRISVVLYLKKMNGYRCASKAYTFDEAQIEEITEQLKNKNGDFYLNDDIWQAICRVERAKVSNKMRFAVYKRDGYRCRKCGRKTDDLEVDHIFPISKGGKSVFSNLQTLCHRCNAIKSNTVEPGVPKNPSRKTGNALYCTQCGALMLYKKSQYGDFYGCSNYPKCNFIKKI